MQSLVWKRHCSLFSSSQHWGYSEWSVNNWNSLVLMLLCCYKVNSGCLLSVTVGGTVALDFAVAGRNAWQELIAGETWRLMLCRFSKALSWFGKPRTRVNRQLLKVQ